MCVDAVGITQYVGVGAVCCHDDADASVLARVCCVGTYGGRAWDQGQCGCAGGHLCLGHH